MIQIIRNWLCDKMDMHNFKSHVLDAGKYWIHYYQCDNCVTQRAGQTVEKATGRIL